MIPNSNNINDYNYNNNNNNNIKNRLTVMDNSCPHSCPNKKSSLHVVIITKVIKKKEQHGG